MKKTFFIDYYQVHKRHNSDISLSTIAEETGSHLNTSLGQDTASLSSCDSESRPEPGSSVQSSYNGTSVFLEPHITVETSTLPAQVRFSPHHHLSKCRGCPIFSYPNFGCCRSLFTHSEAFLISDCTSETQILVNYAQSLG